MRAKMVTQRFGAGAGGSRLVADGRIRATYRVQFEETFPFAAAERLAGYFAALGVSHVYCSPIFEARAGSQHGYDMVDPLHISAALGGEAGFRRMAAALKAEGVGLVLDIVPNHMAADPANPYWTDVLEFGAGSAFAFLFDIDFSRRIALPWLGGPDEAAITGLAYDDAGRRVVAMVASQPVPLRPASVAMLLDRIGALEAAELWRLLEGGPQRRQALDAARAALGSAVAEAPASFRKALESADRAVLHAAQHWEAVPWRETSRLNYRRFFEVSHLLGVRIEDEAAFEIVHRLPLQLLREGLVDGLRVDHIDGLADPAAYAVRLREEAGEDALILIEKILGAEEELRPWPIDGTTGYERLNLINRAFVAPHGRAAFEAHLAATGLVPGTPAERLFAAKRLVIERSFQPELERLKAAALPLAGPVTETALRTALVALLAAFPVYRSYIAELPPTAADRALWNEAGRRVASAEPDSAALAGRLVAAALDAGGPEADRFRVLFQQLSGPAMAKGFEDTELYRSVAMTALNEVGADLATPLPDIGALHAAFAGFSPGGFVPLATHDTKRGADTRARLALLSHDAEGWLDHIRRWSERHAALKAGDAPDAVDEWLIYQTLFATWPLPLGRARTYFEKAIREAKRHGSWNDPDQAYEEGLFAFLATLIEGEAGARFRDEMAALVREKARDAGLFAVSQAVLQLTLPGIPDLYRGTELSDLSLVDPDNRRPVDWERRVALAVAPPRLAALDDPEGIAKFRVIRALLALRAAEPAPFSAPYEPLGIAEPGWLAFQRGRDGATLVVAVPLTPEAARQGTITFADGSAEGVWRSALDPDGGEVVVAAGRLSIDAAMPPVVLIRPEPAS